MKVSRKRKIGYCLLPLIMFLFWRAEPGLAAKTDAFDVVQVTKEPVDEYTSFRISGDGKKVAYRVSTEISENDGGWLSGGRIYSLYLANADGSGSPVLIDSTTGLPAYKDIMELNMLGIMDISYDGGKVLYSIYRYSSSTVSEGYYFIYDASTGSKSEVGYICISDPPDWVR